MSLQHRLRHLAGASMLLLCASAQAAHPPHSGPGDAPVQVAIVLFDGVQIIDFSAPYEVFGQAGFGVYTVSADGAPVITAMGLRVTPDHAFADAPPAHVLLVPGGDVGDAAKDAALLAFVRERSGSARHVLSVCTGSNILAASGLLDGRRATTFHQDFDALAKAYPAVDVVRDARWVDSGRIVTSAGLSSGIDAALHLVARLRGEDVARSTALHLEYDWSPDGGFVRGVLADRWLPDLATAHWPEDTQFHRLTALGDTQAWSIRYHVDTPATPALLLERIADAMVQHPEWTRDGETYRFVATPDGTARELVFSTIAGDAGGFVLDVTLRPVAPP